MTQSLARSARQLLRSIRHTPDRWLHPRRRALAEQLLQTLPSRVVFICSGNICRSPYAAAAFELLLEHAAVAGRPSARRPVVESAGLLGPGRCSPPAAQEAAARRGVSLSAHRSRLLESTLAAPGTLYLVMEEWQRAAVRERVGPASRLLLLGDLDPQPIDTRRILDPIERDEAYFAAVYARIDRCLARLARAWERTW